MRLRQHRTRGFTLVEILVALTIVAITLGAGIKAASSLTDNTARLNRVMAAQWCAENQLVELRLTKQFPGVGDSGFSCEQLGLQFQGRQLVRPTPNPNFRRVEAIIQDEAGQNVLNITTIMGRY